MESGFFLKNYLKFFSSIAFLHDKLASYLLIVLYLAQFRAK
jgi:hypothetical protein